MTQDEIRALTERELEIAVGREVMGYDVYHYVKGDQGYFLLQGGNARPVVSPVATSEGIDMGRRSTEAEAWSDTPCFARNGDALLDMEEEIMLRRLTETYHRIIRTNRDPRASLLRGQASREECLRAALIAVTEEKQV